MELGAIIQQIMKLPARAQQPLLQGLKLNQATHTPAGAVLVAMHLLVALGVPQRIDFVMGELHTPLEALRKSWADGKKSIPSSGIILCLLVADMLAYPKRITRVFKVEELAKLWHTDKLLGIDPTLLNDDRILRALSRFGASSKAMTDVLQATTTDIAERYGIKLSRFYVDGTLLQLDGAFAQAQKVQPGRGVDSLSQLVTSMVVASGSRLPVSFQVYSGNTNDSTTLPQALVAMNQVAPPGPIEWIADRIFPTAKNILFLQDQTDREYRFISPLKTGLSEKRFRELVEEAWSRQKWKSLTYRSAEEIRKNKERSYQSCQTEWTLADIEKPELAEGQTQRPRGSSIRREVTVRCEIYRHGNKAEQERKGRELQKAACEAALQDFTPKLNKRKLQTLEECQRAGQKLLKDFSKVSPFIHLHFTENAHKAILLSWTWDESALAKEELYDGVFAYLTNHSPKEVSANEMLRRYRDRNQIEMNFRDLKGLLDLERIFIQIPERMDAYLFVKVLAYYVLAFLRWYTEEHGFGKMTETKIQDQLSELGMSSITIEPLTITKWNVANDNALAVFLRTAFQLPDPHETIQILNDVESPEERIEQWYQLWKQSNPEVGQQDPSG